MANKNNKIADSEHRDYIEELLLSGRYKYRELSQLIQDEKGFTVSHSTLQKYHVEQLGGMVDKADIDDLDDLDDQDTGEESGQVIEFRQDIRNSDISKSMFTRQLHIVSNKQIEYMNGRGRYPFVELKALKLMQFVPDTANDELLKGLYARQLQIAEAKQKEYEQKQGKGRFPELEMKALKFLTDLLKANDITRESAKFSPQDTIQGTIQD